MVDFIRDKFIWAKTDKTKIDIISEEHDKRIAENYVFDEVQGIYVPRAEHERKARFNSDTYSPTKDEIRRFPSRPKQEQHKSDNNQDYTLTPPLVSVKDKKHPSLKPPGLNKNRL